MPLGPRHTSPRPSVRTWSTICAVATFAIAAAVQPSADAAVSNSTLVSVTAAAHASKGAGQKGTGSSARPRMSVTAPRTGTRARSVLSVRVQKSTSRSARRARLQLRFPDGSHRAKTSLVHPRTGIVYVVTAEKKASIYRTPRRAKSGRNALKKVSAAPRHIAGGAFSTDGKLAALATSKRAFVYDSFKSAPKMLTLPAKSRSRSVRFDDSKTHLIVSTKGGGQTAVPLSAAVPVKVDSSGKLEVAAGASAVTNWTPSFGDEFDTIDPSHWNVRNQTYSANEDSYLMAANATASGGVLKIRAANEAMGPRSYTSGYLDSNNKVNLPNYFRAEVRAKVPMQQGMWAAPLWFRPADYSGGEIDLLETYGVDRAKPLVHHTIHTDYGTGHQQSHVTTPFASFGDSTGTGWHTYVIEKTPGAIVMYTDGVKTASFSQKNVSWFNQYYEAGKSWTMRSNLQVGGGSDNKVDSTTDWSGENTTMQVDYIRTWIPG